MGLRETRTLRVDRPCYPHSTYSYSGPQELREGLPRYYSDGNGRLLDARLAVLRGEGRRGRISAGYSAKTPHGRISFRRAY